MSVVERAFLLRGTAPFDLLEDQELMNIAAVLRVARIPAGEAVVTGGRPAGELIILAEGGLTSGGGGESLQIAGVKSLLRGTAAEVTVRAGREGALVMKLGRGHFFTTIYECSSLLVGFMKLLDRPDPYFC